MWSANRSLNYGLGSEIGMLGLRDVFVVAPPSSFNHHHDNHLLSDPHSLGVGVGVIPLLSAARPCLAPGDDDDVLTSRPGGGGIHLWHHNHNHNPNHHQPTQHYFKKTPSSSLDHVVVGGGLASSSSATLTCQDCGNQAKKDCSHRRCRTCCRSRGFDCTTHVKSTWVPASRRRERQLMAVTGNATAGSSGSTSGAKKPRLLASQTNSHTSTSNTTPPRSLDTTSSHQDAGLKEGLPGQVRAPAIFKCVRVTAVDGGDDEYAYQAVVKIGGHVFKGFLYDQGVEPGDGFPNVSDLHLGDGGGSGSGGVGSRNNRNGGSSSSPFVDPSAVFNGGGGAAGYLGGSNYGNQIS